MGKWLVLATFSDADTLHSLGIPRQGNQYYSLIAQLVAQPHHHAVGGLCIGCG